MRGSKDSILVAQFMSSFSKLKDWTDGDPAGLSDLAKDDERLRELCSQLYVAASDLKRNERRHRLLFAEPVDMRFKDAWRDFEERFEHEVSDVVMSDIFDGLNLQLTGQRADPWMMWGHADAEGLRQADSIEEVINLGLGQATEEGRGFREGFREEIEEGVAAWDRLKSDAGFDLKGIFRRRALVPFVLVPRHVASKYSQHDKLSMLRNLQEAHDAFVFGALLAALSLMRSVMEAMLRDHYGAAGWPTLEEKIDNAKRLPAAANAQVLHRLRRLANDVLHLNPRSPASRLPAQGSDLEREIVLMLKALRTLIEAAPLQATR